MIGASPQDHVLGVEIEMMAFLDLTLPSIEENLALDEALLLEAEAGRGGEVLRLWERPSYAVILGSAGILAEDVNETVCETDGVPLARRCSGGGTVLLGPGCLLFSLVLSYERAAALTDVTHSYTYILERLAIALSGTVDIRPAGTSDLAMGAYKVSGNSQRRMRTHLLHHGTLIYDFDITRCQRYLRVPRRRPAYRERRGHEDFMRNVPMSATEIKAKLQSAWDAFASGPPVPAAVVQQLVAEKYGTREWTQRR